MQNLSIYAENISYQINIYLEGRFKEVTPCICALLVMLALLGTYFPFSIVRSPFKTSSLIIIQDSIYSRHCEPILYRHLFFFSPLLHFSDPILLSTFFVYIFIYSLVQVNLCLLVYEYLAPDQHKNESAWMKIDKTIVYCFIQ